MVQFLLVRGQRYQESSLLKHYKLFELAGEEDISSLQAWGEKS